MSNYKIDGALSQIIENPEATMGQVVCNSVAMAILQLKKNYYPDSVTDDILYRASSDFIKTLTNLEVSDFILKDIHTDEALINELNAELKPTVEFMIAKMQEPVDFLDRVTLYQNGHYEIFELPLIIVLPLVVRALMDDSRFSNAYTGSINEVLEKAINDRPLRLLSLFRCFQRAKVGICHTGVRNELVSLLNGVYDNLYIIEDARATVEYFLKEKIDVYLKNAIKSTTPDSEDEKILLAGVYAWMIDSDVSLLLEKIDPDNQIQDELFLYFIKHGSNPDHVTINDGETRLSLANFIVKIKNALPYHKNMNEEPIFAMIDTLLNANIEEPNQNTRNLALIKVQAWIVSNFKLNTRPQEISRFFTAYQAHLLLQKYKNILHLSGNISEDDIHLLMLQFEDYFQIVASANTQGIFPSPDNNLLAAVDLLQKQIRIVKQENFADKIENFFTHWFAARNNHDLKSTKYLYSMLLEEKILEKIVLSDEIIAEWDKRVVEEKGNLFRDISPYEINRIFLHAIVTPPHEWSQAFVKVFNITFSFVKQGSIDNKDQLYKKLINDSYPHELLRQLEYLKLLREGEPVDRPKSMLLLPRDIKSASDWQLISSWMSNEKRDQVYQALHPAINRYLMASVSDDKNNLASAIISLPGKAEVLRFFQYLKNKEIDLSNIITYIKDNVDIYSSIPVEHFEAICESCPKLIKNSRDFKTIFAILNGPNRAVALNKYKNIIPIIIKDIYDLPDVLINLDYEQKIVVFETVKNLLPELIHGPTSLAVILGLLNIEKSIELYQILDEKLLKIITNHRDFLCVMKDLNEEKAYIFSNTLQKKSFCISENIKSFKEILRDCDPKQCEIVCKVWKNELENTLKSINVLKSILLDLDLDKYKVVIEVLKSSLFDIIKSCKDFYTLSTLSYEKWNFLCESLSGNFHNIIKNTQDLNTIVLNINREHLKYFLNLMIKIFPTIIQNGNDYKNLFKSLDRDNREYFFNISKSTLPVIIKSAKDFEDVLLCLETKARKEVFESFKSTLPVIIRSAKDFKDVLLYLDKEARKEVFESFKSTLPAIIKSAEDFDCVLYFLDEEDRKEVFESYNKSDFNNMIKNCDDLFYVLRCLGNRKRKFVCDNLDHRLLNIMPNSSDFFERLGKYSNETFAYICNTIGKYRDDHILEKNNIKESDKLLKSGELFFAHNPQKTDSNDNEESPNLNMPPRKL